jgi:uncharacterized membrane protein YczE
MDHPCHKCGHSVEDGKAFCSQCGAPQIRVAVAEAPPPGEKGSTNDLPVFALDPPVVSASLSPPAFSAGIEWSRALKSCAVAALISIVVMSLRMVVPPLATLGAGCLAVILYYRRNPAWRVNARSGAQLGAVAGILSSAVFAIFFAIVLAVLQSGGQARQQMIEALQQIASRSHDSQVQAFLDLLKTPEGLVAKLIFGMVGFLLISVAAGTVAGALTGAFLGRKNRS